MPRLARLDAPGVLHHVMGRGIGRRKIVQNDTDRQEFVDRLNTLAIKSALDVCAWTLMPNPICWSRLATSLFERICAICKLVGKEAPTAKVHIWILIYD